jgi:tRNA1Val (adenine37-N6)-methyltransferase
MKVSTDACIFGALIPEIVGDKKVLDIGTGTGLLSLMIAQKNNNLQIDAIEILKQAALQATENIATSGFKNNINIVHADIKKYNCATKYDVVICNPPFFENDLKTNIETTDTAKHSTTLTLQDVAIVIKNLIVSDAQIFLLLPTARIKLCEALFNKQQLYLNKITNIKHTPLHASKNSVLQFSNIKLATETNIFIIKNEDGSYSNEMNSLMQAYYL